MSIIVAPLGDSHFIDIGLRSPNNFGVDIGFLSDIWGGEIPATIPNSLAALIEAYQLTDYDCLPPSMPIPEPAYALLIAMAMTVFFLRCRA